jgi:hypothetical protein
VQLPSPAHAVALQGLEDESLYADTIMVGLESDRFAALGEGEDARYMVWNAYDFALEAEEDWPGLRADPEYVEARARACKDLLERGVEDPRAYALNRVARGVAAAAPLRPVTDDFVVFCFRDDMDDLLAEDLRFSALAEALAQLAAKGLLP